jgi:flavorubredoxin
MSQMIKLMNDSTAFCIGTPTLNKNALPPAVQLLSSLDTINVIDKNILVFGSYG